MLCFSASSNARSMSRRHIGGDPRIEMHLAMMLAVGEEVTSVSNGSVFPERKTQRRLTKGNLELVALTRVEDDHRARVAHAVHNRLEVLLGHVDACRVCEFPSARSPGKGRRRKGSSQMTPSAPPRLRSSSRTSQRPR